MNSQSDFDLRLNDLYCAQYVRLDVLCQKSGTLCVKNQSINHYTDTDTGAHSYMLLYAQIHVYPCMCIAYMRVCTGAFGCVSMCMCESAV